MWETVTQLFPYAIAYTIPLLITALGGLFSERSGVVNIGLEGLMVIGSFSGAFFIQLLAPHVGAAGAIWLGLLIAAACGMLVSLLHAFASINLGANQIISGTAINMIAGALTVFLSRNITGSGNIRVEQKLNRFSIPVLKDVPFLGPLLFTETYMTTWVVLAVLAVSVFVLYKTSFGLRLRSCGENPHAADAAGIRVWTVRYMGVVLSGAFAGLGGFVMLVTYAGEFTGSVAGLGFLALASLIFGQWKPLGILGATLFFGFAMTLGNVSKLIPALSSMPSVVLKIFPYVVTLIALVFFSKTSAAPLAAGEPFDHGKK